MWRGLDSVIPLLGSKEGAGDGTAVGRVVMGVAVGASVKAPSL